MKKFLLGCVFSLLFSLSWSSLLYLGYHTFNLPLPPVILFEWIVKKLPGSLVNLGLEMMIKVLYLLKVGSLDSAGKTTEFVLAFILSILGLTLFGGLIALLFKPSIPWFLQGGIAGAFIWGGSALLLISENYTSYRLAIALIWLLIIMLGWSLGVTRALALTSVEVNNTMNPERKDALNKLLIGSLAWVAVSFGVESFLKKTNKTKQGEFIRETLTPTWKPLDEHSESVDFQPVPGTRPEITPIEDFYRVDITLLPPDQFDLGESAENFSKVLAAQGIEFEAPAEAYRLFVVGLVENPLILNLPMLKSYPTVELYSTLSCISNPIGGDLIGTTRFKGVRLKDILNEARPKPEVIEIKFTCADGYTESLPIDSALDPNTLLCYEMGGQPLSKSHGAPIRLLTPNRYGMKNPKWIIKIEAINQDYLGYWEQRGWSKQAWIQSTAVIDSYRKIGDNIVEVGGIAYTGSRGIRSVELRIDQGEWIPCIVKEPLSQHTWALWRVSTTISSGRHRLYVRVIDGEGEPQKEERLDTFPSGATGYHSILVNIQ